MSIEALRSVDSESAYWEGNNKTVSEFYYDDKFGNSSKEWLANTSATKATGTSFGETIDLSGNGVYIPIDKNKKKKVGVTVNAGAGDDTITGTQYNDVITAGLGTNTIVYKLLCKHSRRSSFR